MTVFCPGCQLALPQWLIRTRRAHSTCPSCYAKLTVELFPAAFRRRSAPGAPATLVESDTASCYEHATKPAKAICSQCGRFVCALCEVEMSGAVWCPVCLRSPNKRTAAPVLETQRTNYDSIALALATWPVLGFLYPSLLTAPVVVYLVIRYWKSERSLIPRNKWRFVAALLIALIELAVLVALIVAIVVATQRRVPGR